MSDTGVKYPGTTASTAESPYDDKDWSYISRLTADDNSLGGIVGGAWANNSYSYLGKLSNFSCSVPAGATVNGIKVEMECCDYGGTSYDVLVQLSKDNTNRVGDNKARNANVGNALTVYTYGGTADLWNTTWTAAEVNSSSFAVHLAAQSKLASGDAEFYADYLRVTVYYTESAAQGGTVSATLGTAAAESSVPGITGKGLIAAVCSETNAAAGAAAISAEAILAAAYAAGTAEAIAAAITGKALTNATVATGAAAAHGPVLTAKAIVSIPEIQAAAAAQDDIITGASQTVAAIGIASAVSNEHAATGKANGQAVSGTATAAAITPAIQGAVLAT